MEFSPLLLTTIGSLVAILLLYLVTRAFGLGGDPLLHDAQDVARVAGETFDGFDPVRSAIGEDGRAALAEDREGRIVLVRRHGNRFAGRVLDSRARAACEGGAIRVDAGDARFGTVRLAIGDADCWAAAINRL